MGNSSSNKYLSKFVFWYNRLPKPVLYHKSEEFIMYISHISEAFNKLSNKAQNDENLSFNFRSINDIKEFISDTLKLSDNHCKWAYFLKGILLSHKEFTWDKYVKKNRNVTMFKYFRTLLFHLWFWKGKVEPGKCVPIVTTFLT